jgi:hypothetical protein
MRLIVSALDVQVMSTTGYVKSSAYINVKSLTYRPPRIICLPRSQTP